MSTNLIFIRLFFFLFYIYIMIILIMKYSLTLPNLTR